MSERAPYSRIYWSVLDDPKFDAVRADMRHFGSWSLMLVVADMAYPAPAFIPPSVPRGSLSVLSDVGLIDLLPARMYRLHGLQAERERRAAAATRDPKRTPTASQAGPNGDPESPLDETRTRRDETRQPARATEIEAMRSMQINSRMQARRLEWFRETGKWDEDWGEKPVAPA